MQASGESSLKVFDDTRDVIREALATVEAGDVPRVGPNNRRGILVAYESLCRMLEDVDPEQLKTLIGRIAEQLDRLNRLAGDVERIRRLRQSMHDT